MPPQLGGSQVTVRLRLCSQRLLEVWNWQVPHAPQLPVRQTPFTGDEAVQLALVGLPQLGPWHGTVAEPLRQEASFDAVALLPAEVWLREPEQPLPQFSVLAGQSGRGQRPVVVPSQLPRHRHQPPPRSSHSPAEQPVVLHTPFTGGKTVQVAVGLPQLGPWHGTVAEPLRQEASFDAVALLPAEVWLREPEQPLPQFSVLAGQSGRGQRPVVVPSQLPRHRHQPPPRSSRSPAEQPVVLHTPFTGGEAVQLLLVALPQLPAQPHGNVAEPVRQDAVFDAFALLPPEAALTGPEQLVLPLLQLRVVAEQLDVQDCVSVPFGLVESGQSSPPQPAAGSQVTDRLRLCLQLPPDSWQAPQPSQAPVRQTPSLGALPVQVRVAGPEQLPPHAVLHVRVCVPCSPQTLVEQALQADQIGPLPVQV